MNTTFHLKCSYDGFKRWDIIRIYDGDKGIIIRIKDKKGNVNISVFPYEEQDNKVAQFAWYWCLRLCVFLRLI